MKKLLIPCVIACLNVPMSAQQYSHVVTSEPLDRGVVAAKTDNAVFVSWRSLADDDPSTVFDIYRDGVKINEAPLSLTNYTDADGVAGASYEVKCLVDGVVTDAQTVTAWPVFYHKIHLDRPEGGTSPAGGNDEMRDYTYTPDDVSVGDVDGDGQYEFFVKWFPTNQADNSFRRYTGNTMIDCYKMDGTKLWRIDLGINIRSGNHYTQFMVYDFDGDGKAELICKTAPGTVDGRGNFVIMGNDDPTADYRSKGTNSGIIISGPEYLTVFDGQTGAEINTIAYNPPRDIHPINKSNWGDDYGNRCERYLACVAYLDGQHPSAVFCRGYYTYSYLWAVDFDGEKLTERWLHASDSKGKGAYGEGAHAITVGDVDADGKDEIVYGAACIDDDGSLLYRTGFGHGDALHLAAMLPDRQGLQVFMPHEEKSSAYKWDAELRDALTGEVLFGNPQSGADNGRGLAANISANWPGYEYWSTVHRNPQNQGVDVGNKNLSVNFRVYWDGDVLDELLDGTTITKPNDQITSVATLAQLTAYSNAASCNGTKKTPNLQADILGDWREEIILHDSSTESDLLIFTTTIPSEYKVTCLMQDRQYREAVAWQNVAYNQPPHLSYNLEEKFNTSAAFSVTEGNLNQVVKFGSEMSPVLFSVKRATGIVVAEKPEWIVVDFDDATLKGSISGTPTADGEFSYVIKTTGAADDANATLQGSIVVRRPVEPVGAELAYFPMDQLSLSTPNLVYGEAEAVGDGLSLVGGLKGNAINFDGNSYLSQYAYDAIQMDERDFSISFWMRSTDSDGYIFFKGSHKANASAGTTGHWIGIERKNGYLSFTIDDDVTKTDCKLASADYCFDGAWHHVCAVRNFGDASMSLYIDGALAASASSVKTGAIRDNMETMMIGNSDEASRIFAGTIDELLITSYAMDAVDVQAAYDALKDQASGITALINDGEAVFTVVDAYTGRIVRCAVGSDRFDIIDTLGHGVYLLVKETQTATEIYKVIGN